MLTGLVVWILIIILRFGVCFLVIPSFLERVRSRLVYRSHPPSLNVRLCRLFVVKLYGSMGC